MEQPQRLIFLALAIGWTIFRLLRYLRAGSASRPGPAQRPAEAPAPVVQSPIEPADSRPGILARLTRRSPRSADDDRNPIK